MRAAKALVTRLSGHRNRSCYFVLCCAVEVARQHQPLELPLKNILEEVQQLLASESRKPATLSKALSRAVIDLWESGNRAELEKIFGRKILDCPTPREIIYRLAEFIWEQDVA